MIRPGIFIKLIPFSAKKLRYANGRHFEFEWIHPFQDGNGRVGRLIMFKECLAHDLVPFIIDSEHKLFYYRGLRQYAGIPEYLDDTCLSAQDHYREVCKKFKV